MPKKYLTIEDLLVFCKQTNLNTFSSQDAGGPIVIQSFGKIKMSDNATMGLTPCTLMACHTELNRNKSFITEDVMNQALSSFSNRPILGYIHQLEDGTWNFWDHRMNVEENEDGEAHVEYLERPIGVVPESCNAHLEYDEEKDKTYVVVNGFLYDDYGNRAVDIINENDGQVDVSVEIAINQMSYNAKENYLNIEDFVFMGVTCLGKTPDGEAVAPGMEGSNLKLDNFSTKENSMFADNFQDKLVEILDKLDATLSNFSNQTQEGGDTEMDKFKELLEEYGFTEEELDFDHEGMTDEELEAAFEDYACRKKKKCSEDDDDNELIVTEDEACKKKKKCSLDEEGNMSMSFEISHEDIRSALYNLIGIFEEEDNDWYWITNVYDEYFIFENWCGDKLYKQPYDVDGDNVSLSGDRQQMFKMVLTESEKLAIEKMRDDYSALEAKYNELKEFKDQYDTAKDKAEKDAIFESAEYAEIKESDEFKALVADADKYSVDELKVKADLIFAASMKQKFSFKEDRKPASITFSVKTTDETNKKPYGDLFEE